MKILVVEDDENIIILVKQALHHVLRDVQVDIVSSLESAINKVIKLDDDQQTIPYSLIIVDIFLEGRGTGFDLIKVINLIYPNIPFLVMTSLKLYFVEECLAEVKSNHMTYLRKPFLLEDFKQAINSLMQPTSSSDLEIMV